MGVGNRMKKQGMPEPLSEAKFAALKRKKQVESATQSRGKKRTASGDVVQPPPKKAAKDVVTTQKKDQNGLKANGTKPQAKAKATAATQKKDQNGVKANGTRFKAKAKAPIPQESSDISSDDDAADFEDASEEGSIGDLEQDEDLEPDKKDDFLSGSSVYDSDLETKGVMWSEDEDESDAEEKLTAANIAGLSRKLDAEQEAEAANAQLELEEAALQTNISGDRPKILSDSDSESGLPATNLHLAPDLQLLRTRITDTIRVLDDFSKLAEPGRSRSEYMAQFEKDVTAYYGYSPFLASVSNLSTESQAKLTAKKLISLFSPREAFQFFEANESPRPVVLRTNTLKTHRRELAQALIARGVTLEPVGKWSKVGLQVFESQVPLGATPEYLAGHYILQAASSFLPVMALAPQEHERVLDMASAPGGKASHMAALMKNTGAIFANDSNKLRAKALIGNVHRLGVKNVIVCAYDAKAFPTVIGGFDRVLLDAPCSGTGVIAKDPSVKTNKTPRDFLALPHLQRQLILAAIDSVDHKSSTGGYIVYSTCSVTIEENEQVVEYALRKRPNVRIVETGLPFGVEGFTNYMGKSFDKNMKWTRRYYPHTYNVDGFYVCKLKKTGPSPAQKKSENNGATNGIAVSDDMEVDKAPIGDENDDDFGGFDSEEDKAIMEKAKTRSLKRRGLDPKANKGARREGGRSSNQ